MNSPQNFAPIAALDLDPIKVKLMHQESGEGWSLEQANAVEFEYRRFLYLMKLFPHEQTAPLFDVDIFWHYHILDTMKYAADCEQVFGYFLHHFPYSGLRGEEDEVYHERIGARMQELYEVTFGEAYIQQPESNGATARRPEPGAQAAWSDTVGQKTAWLQGVAPTSAWCSNTVATKTAYSQGVPPRTAYSQGVAAKTAITRNVIAQTAYSQGVTGISAWPAAGAQHVRAFNLARPSLA